MAEWLRRQPAKLMGFPRVGSSPIGVDLLFVVVLVVLVGGWWLVVVVVVVVFEYTRKVWAVCVCEKFFWLFCGVFWLVGPNPSFPSFVNDKRFPPQFTLRHHGRVVKAVD